MGNDSVISTIASVVNIIVALITIISVIFGIIKWREKKLKDNKEILLKHWSDKNNIKITLYEEGPGTIKLDSLKRKLELKIGLLSSTFIVLENSDNISVPLAKVKIKIKDNQLNWKLVKNNSEYQFPKKTILYEAIEIYTF